MKGEKWKVYLTITFVLIIIFIILAYKFGIIQDMFGGEEYDKVHYPELYNHWDSWTSYFKDKGRPLEGFYWTYLYKIIGYSPREFHTASLSLHALASLLATIAFSRTWLRFNKSVAPWIPSLILLTVFFNGYSLILATKISFDAPSIAFITLYATAISMQNWAKGNFIKIRWLAISLLLIFLTIFNYEVAVFLLPITFVLSWPLNSLDNESRRKIAKVFFLAAISSIFLIFIPYFTYKTMSNVTGLSMAHPGMNSSSFLSIDSLLQFPKNYFMYFLLFGADLLEDMVASQVILFLSLASSLVYALRYSIIKFVGIRKIPDRDWSLVLMNGKYSIVLASLWIILVGFGTYALIGYEPPNTRIYLGGMFGLSILLVFQFANSKKLSYKLASALLIGAYITVGVYTFFSFTSQIRTRNITDVKYFLGITEVLPGIRENSNLLLVEHKLSTSGCAPAFMILFQTKDLRCGFLSSEYERYIAEKYESEINAHEGGWFRNENNILIGIDEFGNPFLIESITPESDLLIIWHEQTPITTDEKRIENNYEFESSPMYIHLLELSEEFSEK